MNTTTLKDSSGKLLRNQDSSSVDTELEVSINNAHLLTNLAKAVQDKERKSNFTATSEGTKVIQT